jgi:hypothetical protein
MTILTMVGAYAGLGLLVLMALTPILVEFEQRLPAAPRTKAPARERVGLDRRATPASA